MIAAGQLATAKLDVTKIREDFPVLRQTVHGKPLVYLDSAATAQKPYAVIDAVRRFNEVDCANIHRGVHELSQRSTVAYEKTRATAVRYLNAASESELIFVRGATEAINLVAHSWGRRNVKPGDEIIISALEHHSNIVPWQMLCEEQGRVAARHPDRRSRRLDSRRIREAAQPAHADGGRIPRLERAGHDQPGADDHRDGPSRPAPGAARRCPGRFRT